MSAGSAGAAEHVDLVDPDVRLSDSFYPCPLQAAFDRPPYVEECLDSGPAFTPLVPLIVGGTTSCDANGTSTIQVTQRSSGFGFVPGGGWLGSNLTWSLTATIGAQNLQPMPNYQPFPDDGMRMESIGFNTGAVTSFTGSFGLDVYPVGAGPEDISGNLSLLPNVGNWGVCRNFYEELTGNPVFGSAPITGDFYILNLGVLSYEVTSGPAGLLGETGVAETYFMNSFASCCDAENPTQVNSATGHFKAQFGTTHPGSGTSGSASIEIGTGVTVDTFAGLDEDVGGVSLTFPEVTAGGSVSVTLLTSMPDQPSGFQVGDPPAVYEITPSPELEYVPPVKVCLPYGSLPFVDDSLLFGVDPRILHYKGGEWVDVTTEVLPMPDYLVCGAVDSFSPFAVGYFENMYSISGPFEPVNALPTVNTMKAGRTVPVKFSLGGDFGLDVFESGYPKSAGDNCAGLPTDTIETTSTNPSGLHFDATTGTYQYNWKTQSSWKGQCRTLILRFTDGQELQAKFKFN